MNQAHEPLTLDELQLAKSVLEAKAADLRMELHALRYSGQQDWRTQFAHKQAKLLEVVTEIGGLNRRILKLVEGEAGPQKEDE